MHREPSTDSTLVDLTGDISRLLSGPVRPPVSTVGEDGRRVKED